MAAKDWTCQECGKRMTLKHAERAVYGDGCPRCGGADIDLDDSAPVPVAATVPDASAEPIPPKGGNQPAVMPDYRRQGIRCWRLTPHVTLICRAKRFAAPWYLSIYVVVAGQHVGLEFVDIGRDQARRFLRALP